MFLWEHLKDCMVKEGGRRDAHSSRWRNLPLARAVLPERDVFVAVPGHCFRLHCWAKQQRGKNLITLDKHTDFKT